MNKKFFAALASATMAFTASGSIAVFADDFVEEKTPTVKPDEIKPTETKVKWDEEHFGDLAKVTNPATWVGVNWTEGKPTLEDGYVKTVELEKVTAINLQAGFNGKVKGLEYFSNLETFSDALVVADDKNVTNETLDFSANTKLQTLHVHKAADLTGIELPNSYKNTDDEDVFDLTTLVLQNTKITSLDLSDYSKLNAFVANNNYNLSEVVLPKGKSSDYKTMSNLNLVDNALETVNLDYLDITTLNLGGNHIGALDLSKTTATNVDLGVQRFYISEDAINVKLTEAFPELKVWNVSSTTNAKFDQNTALFTLNKNENVASYTYKVAFKGDTTKDMTVQITKANPMNRLYNPNSGEHFYTADLKEKEALVALGWNDEGTGWVAPRTDDASKGGDVYRLYNPNAGDHHYTMSKEERDTLVAYGWKAEGTGWYSADAAGAKPTTGHVAVYRQYNPFANGAGSHNYTTDRAENDYLVSVGWIYEGTAWTALQ